MQQLQLHKKIVTATLSLCLLLISGVSLAANPIGGVREVTGNTSILRDKEEIEAKENKI